MPAPTEPVIETSCGVGCSTSARPVSRSPQIDVEDARRENSAASSASRSVVTGVVSLGLRTTVLPAAIAGRELPDRHHHRVVPRRDLADDADRLAPDERGVARPCTRPRALPSSIRAAPAKKRIWSTIGGISSRRSARAACRCSGSPAPPARRRAPRPRRRSAAAPAAARTAWCRASVSNAVGRGGVGAVDVLGAGHRRGAEDLTGGRVDQVHPAAVGGVDVLPADEVAQYDFSLTTVLQDLGGH